jgi:hypothetical protein
MPCSAQPHYLDTATRQGAGHSGLTRNKAGCGIEKTGSRQEALEGLLRVTFHRHHRQGYLYSPVVACVTLQSDSLHFYAKHLACTALDTSNT